MKRSRNIVLSVLLAVCAVCLCFALVGCKSGDKDAAAKYGYGEEGFYYYDGADSARYMLSLQSGTYMITVNGASAYSGTYSYDEESGNVSFKGDNEFAATMGESALSLSVEGSGYSFKAYKFFEVTYVDETGKTIAVESVLNGQSAEAPEIEKDGYWFIDWYIDSSNSAAYSFDTSIAGDTVIYGWYIEKNVEAVEHTVTLDYGDGVTEVWGTTNGAVYKTLPAENSDGEAIIGWWVSATNKSGELTYRYTLGDVFDADTTLFAVYSGIGSSVTSAGVTWDAASAGSNVSIEIKSSDGETVISESSLSSTSGVYTSSAFSSLESGVYTVEVKSGSVTDTLVYVVNGLARVSLSSADIIENGSGRVLSFAPVEGADGYLITVTNGERTVTEDLGNKTYYNFSSWEMTKEGITFVVTAYGEGYADSESDAYTYIKVLGDVAITISEDVVSWNRVEGALEYAVTISDADGVAVDFFYTSDTSFSLKYYENGTYDITVQPHTDGYYSEAKTYFGYAKDSLMAPKVTSVTSNGISWEDVGADYYVVMINGVPYGEDGTITATTLYFSDTSLPESKDGTYEISVKAVRIGGSDSPYSDVVIATGEFSSTISYDKNTVYWSYDVEATSYGISVNGGTEMVVTEGNSAKVTLTKVGDNVITVTAYGGDDEALGSAETTVYAYSITLDPNGAELKNDTAVNGVIYVAQGDELDLGTAEKDHADFVGWYTQADYTEGQSDEYEGKGSLVENGSTFTGNGSMYLYAYWSYEYIDVKLIVGMGSMTDETGASVEEMAVRIKYNSTSYVLPVPAAYNPEDVFNGWYSGNYGAGTQYTTGSGTAVGSPFTGEDTTLYAYYLAVLYYAKTTYDGETVYAVSAGSKINEVTDGVVTIPESYNGCGLVINSNAFENCKTLKVLNIPDTVLYIAVTNDGYRKGAGAFVGCSALSEVNVYATETATEPMYFSEDGVLFHKLASSEDGDVELIYYPYAKTLEGEDEPGTYVIPSVVYNKAEYLSSGIEHNVTTIPTQVFRERNIGKVVISKTVTYVASQAFYNNYNLTSVTFEEGGDAALEICDTAFKGCTALKEVTLPARYNDFNVGAFTDCGALYTVKIEEGGNYKSEDGILLSSDGATLVYFPIGRSGDVDISNLTTETITKIGDKAFYNNGKITSVVVPASVYEIGESAFEGCRSISTLTFAAADANAPALEIKARAFYGCTLLESLTLPVNLVKLGENAFGSCLGLNYVYFDTASPNVTLEFSENAFGSTNYLITLELGKNVPGIENLIGVFDGGNLQEIRVNSENQNYCTDEVGALYNKDGTRILYYPRSASGEYTLDNRCTTIPYGVFTDRVNLTAITLGASVNLIEEGAFDGCYYLEKITVCPQNTSYGSDNYGILYAKAQDGEGNYVLSELLLCPYGCTEANIEISGTVTKIADYAFWYNPYLTSVEIKAETSFTLGEGAFYWCSALEQVVLPECMTYIAPMAFYECENLSSISIPSSVVCIGDFAFYHCYLLTGDLNDATNGVKLPEGLVCIGESAFDMYTGGALGKTSTFAKIQTYAGIVDKGGSGKGDSGNDSSSSDGGFAVTIPASVKYIGDRAFRGCWNSEGASCEIVFASSGDTGNEPDLYIGSYAFAYTQYATGVEIPARVTELGTYAFYYFGASLGSDSSSGSGSGGGSNKRVFSVKTLAEGEDGETYTPVSFEEGIKITELPTSVFEGASNVNSIEIPASVTSIGNKAFYGCTSLETVTFETNAALTSIGDSAFYQAGLKSICIPASVTSIGSSAFYDGECENLSESLTFETESQLETIGSQAFYKTGVTEVALPASLSSLGYSAFQSCTKLTKISFQGQGETSALKEMGYNAFNGCTALTCVCLPNALEKTGSDNTRKNDAGIFGGCTALTTITIPASVKEIMESTFSGCTQLTTVNFEEGSSLEKIGDGAFSGCTSLKSFAFPDTASAITLGSSIFEDCSLDTLTLSTGVAYIGDAFSDATIGTINVGTSQLFSVDTSGRILCGLDGGAIVYVFGELEGDVVLPDEVTAIGDFAFADQTKITSIEIGAGVESIGEYAFYGCTELKKVAIADGALAGDAMGEYAFYDCEKLSDINLPEGLTSVPAHCFDYCSAMTGIELPDSLVEIGDYAFAHSGLENADLNLVETVGDSAFRFDYYLVSVEMTSATTSIGEYAFAVSGIETISLPSSLTSISPYTFRNCDSLVSVTIPEGVKEIGTEAFTYCTSLEKISLPSTLTTLSGAAFSYCSALVECELPSGLSTVGNGVFTNCTALESANVPGKLDEVPQSMFLQCSALESVGIGDGVTSIGSSAFYGCTALESVELGENVTSIGSQAFYGCTSLKVMNLPSGVVKIDTSAFRGCTSLVTCDLPSGLTELGQHAFQECSSLESVVFPAGCKTVTEWCFEDCSSLKTVEFGDGVTTIKGEAFKGCTSLETVVIGHNVTGIGQQAFYGCTSLTYAYTGDLVTSISNSLFYGCTSLEEVDFGTAVKTVESSAFQGCTSLKSVSFGIGLEEIDATAFSGCTSLETVYIPLTVSYVAANAFSGCSCDIYIDNTYNFVSWYWDASWYGGTGTVYYYSQMEPGFNSAFDGYDGNFWHYGEDGEMAAWEFSYATYKVENGGGYVLCTAEDGTVSYVCLAEDDGTISVYEVTECTQGDTEGSYSVTLAGGDSYTVTLTNTEGTLSATVTLVTDSGQ